MSIEIITFLGFSLFFSSRNQSSVYKYAFFICFNIETNKNELNFLWTSPYLGQLVKIYGNPVISYLSINISVRNKISFFELHLDINIQLVRDQIYYNAIRAL